ncbi:methylenetetrahydrofolate reductase [Rhodococcus sp. T2V]|uniref:methylenetetrahydrofolate reductase n=1 Tax=Rhodococcus sp. T2V TaxID=3034164 RepID=UPI0023E0DC96|nr:methylenetetrahydrofolate reductase [Rhodococcus sp. T2V]MDF3311140.1 methylenetetrahydrofolate reductase [Rhodococcus sp. T2V]
MVSRPTSWDSNQRGKARDVLGRLGFEVIPFKKTEEAVLAHVPVSVPLTVTASPAKGQDTTVALAVALTARGYAVTPHLSAQLVRDRAHLVDVVARCRDAGITSAFVVGGDRSEDTTDFHDALALLRSLQDLEHGFTDIGIGGHPEGHPAVSEEVLYEALKAKSEFATHITTQIVFDPKAILAWANEVKSRGIDLPIKIGVPGAVHRQKLLRVSTGLGIGQSAAFLRKQQNMFWRFFLPGGYRPDKIIHGLTPHLGESTHSISGFHVFSFNDLEPTEAWRRRFVESLGGKTAAIPREI